MFLVRMVALPFRFGFWTGRRAARVSYRTGRRLGARRLLLLGAGATMAVLATPTTGPQARARLWGLLKRSSPPRDAELAEKVRFELSHGSATWHLAQPIVAVAGGVVTLTGRSPHQSGRADLARAAAAVGGVTRVENRIELAGSPVSS
jgi:osmotically-inducible protein OsmY